MLHCNSITLDTTADCISEMITCGCVQSVSLHFFTLYPTVCILNSQKFYVAIYFSTICKQLHTNLSCLDSMSAQVVSYTMLEMGIQKH